MNRLQAVLTPRPSRFAKMLVFGVAVAVTSAASAKAIAADVCIDDKAKEALVACAGGIAPKEFKGTKAPAANFHSAPTTTDLKKKDQQMKPGKPNIEEAPRDERKSRLQARQRALLVTEIQGL